MFSVATRDPEMYAQYVMDLFDKGQAQFGTMTVKPGDPCRNYDPTRIDPVDWIALASLRDSENRYMSFAAVDNDAAAITGPTSMVKWFRAAGYATVHSSTQLFGDMVKEDHEIMRAGSARMQGCDVCLLVNSKMLDSMDSLSVTPDHWIVLTKPVKLDMKKREIAVEIFTWGSIRTLPDTGVANLDDFLKNYYGYVAAR
jgi:hypothetical protein